MPIFDAQLCIRKQLGPFEMSKWQKREKKLSKYGEKFQFEQHLLEGV